MPFVTTIIDQSLNSDTLAIDPVLSLTLDANKTYVVQVLYRWEQAAATDGGFKCMLAVNGTGSTFAWTGSLDTMDRADGAPLIFTNQVGPRLVTMTGVLRTGSVSTIVSAYRALARASANVTTVRAYSVLQVGQVGQPFIPSNASLFLP